MNSTYYIRVLVLMCIIASMEVNAQTTQFTGTGSWLTVANWNNGVPTATTNVTTDIGRNPIVDGEAECNNLSLFLSSLTIETEGTLTINGEYSATSTGSNTNNGTLILKGTLKPAIGNVVLTIGGGVESVSGLTFPTFTID